jgi:hypothetical protein
MANLSNINNKFLVTTGGLVGIGITGPSRELDIQAATGWAEIALRGASGAGGSLEFWTTTTKRAEIFADTEDIVFRNTASNVERIRIESTGPLKFANTATSTGDVGTIAHYTNNYMYIRGGTSGLAIGDDGFDVSIYLNNSDSIQFV